MDFQKYINHHTYRSSQKDANVIKQSEQKPRVIKFVGNMQQNIKQLLMGINCHCGNKKEFYNILVVFSNKIQKLRKQRQHYKTTLKQYLITLNINEAKMRKQITSQNLQIQKNSNQAKKKSNKMNLTSLKVVQQQNKQNKPFVKDNQNIKQKNKQVNNNKKYNSKQKQILKTNQKKKKPQLQINSNQKFLTEENVNTSINLQFQNERQILNLKKLPLYSQQKQNRNNFTAEKKTFNVLDNNFTPIKQTKTQDKRLKHFYEDTAKQAQQFLLKDDDIQFSLNLSSFEDNQKQTTQFMKQVSSIMSETNLLQSDGEEDKEDQVFQLKKQSSILQLQQKINKLKMLKQSTNLSILQTQRVNKVALMQISEPNRNLNNFSKKKQNPQSFDNIQLKKVQSVKKNAPSSNKKADKQNIRVQKVQSCLKQYNLTLQRLQEFIENKECIKQMEKNREFEQSLKGFKTFSSCTLKSEKGKKGLSQQWGLGYKEQGGMRAMRGLQQRRISSNKCV